jgi:hypothetical protein
MEPLSRAGRERLRNPQPAIVAGRQAGTPSGMSEERQPMTPDPPLPPGTPQPPDLDIDVDRILGEPEVPEDQDVNPAAGATEPSG